MSESIPQPDSHHLLAAQGWLELGNVCEANEELAHINPDLESHPAVLEIRWQVQARAKCWDECLQIAAVIIRMEPTAAVGWIHRSYALHELHRSSEARDGLVSVAKLFPEELTIPYNLACYECALGNPAKALEWLQNIFSTKRAAEWKTTALADADLKLLWPVIAKL